MIDFELHSPWTLCDNSDYDSIWDIIFEEEGITPEDELTPEEEHEEDMFEWLDEDSELIYDTEVL